MINVKNIALIGLIAVLALAGCTGDGGSSSVNSAYGLTESDFDVTATRSLMPYEVEMDLNEEDLFRGIGEHAGATVVVDPCLDSKMGGYTFTRASATTFKIFANDVDLKDCLSQTGNWVADSYIYSVYMDNVIAKDVNGDIVDLEGMSYFDLVALIPLQYTYRLYSTSRYRKVDTGETLDYLTLSTLHGASALSAPCSFDGTFDGCRYEHIFQVTSHYASLDDYTDKAVIDTHNLEVVDRAPYYQNGTMTFTFNDWFGTMTYGIDAYIPPTYTATNGVDTVSGTYTPPPAPALFQPFSGVPIMPFQRAD